MTVARSSAGWVCGLRRAPGGSWRRMVKNAGLRGSPSRTAIFDPAGIVGGASRHWRSARLKRIGAELEAGATEAAVAGAAATAGGAATAGTDLTLHAASAAATANAHPCRATVIARDDTTIGSLLDARAGALVLSRPP